MQAEVPAACGFYPPTDYSRVWCFVDKTQCEGAHILEDGQATMECKFSAEMHRDVGRVIATNGVILSVSYGLSDKSMTKEDLDRFISTKLAKRADLSPRVYTTVSTLPTQTYWITMQAKNPDYIHIRPGNSYTTFIGTPNDRSGAEEMTVCTVAPLIYTDPKKGKTSTVGSVSFKSPNLYLERTPTDFIVTPTRQVDLNQEQQMQLCSDQLSDLVAPGDQRLSHQ